MPLSSGISSLGTAIIAAGAVVDPAGQTACHGLAGAVFQWIIDNAVVSPLGGTWACATGSILGYGTISFPGKSGTDYGDYLAASIPATDAPGIAKWRAMGISLYNYLSLQGQPSAINIVYPSPGGGPATGVSNVINFGGPFPLLGTTMSLTPPNDVIFNAIGVAIIATMVSNIQIGFGSGLPSGLIGVDGSPPTGATVIR